ncbi:hypothetical protein [Aestuariivirga sp.]|uniref:hypothetical protein n=1 Tax=Aestuariivirga sp. TaxID=2650926 RepID=UPI00378373EE
MNVLQLNIRSVLRHIVHEPLCPHSNQERVSCGFDGMCGFFGREDMIRSLVAAVAMLVTGTATFAGTTNISLAPVPFELQLPSEIAEKLTVEPISGAWAEEVKKWGADAASVVYYHPAEGSRSILMSVYYFPAEKFDAAQNPNEAPPFGREVIRRDGKVFSVAGPQDTIFDAETVDAKNVVASNALIYEPENYTPLK